MTNSEQVLEEIKALGLQPSAQIIPNPVPVVETNPKLLRRCNIVRSISAVNATSATLYTTPSDKDFFLVAAGISVIKDATSTSVISRIYLFPKGDSQRNLLTIGGISLTAQSGEQSITLPNPLQIERGTIINVSNSTNVANVTCWGWLVGYTVEVNQ